ncbi:hydrogenase [Dictyobacter alpinus]|uniref:Hydrogenase n=1 Tax=Dictyobacter alpinus TaxID=2014873 RepID=A0A402BFF1_9CHLR|nr:hydrogenase maturation protease [Dictyobacter alpinus]GCE30115.1 hydrogenase [Dictyobacter alpinus]
MSAKLLLIGAGNLYRSDDSVGLKVVQAIKSNHLPDVDCIEHDADGTGLLEIMAQADTVILVDAVKSGAPPGTIHKFAVHDSVPSCPIPLFSSHDFGVGEAIQLAQVIHQLPRRLTVYGIEGSSFCLGTMLSPAVACVIPDVVALIYQDIQARRADSSGVTWEVLDS